jgi:hypothetical protein
VEIVDVRADRKRADAASVGRTGICVAGAGSSSSEYDARCIRDVAVEVEARFLVGAPGSGSGSGFLIFLGQEYSMFESRAVHRSAHVFNLGSA